MSKQSKRRKFAKLRACMFDGRPLFMMPTATQSVVDAIESADSAAIESAMSFGRDVDPMMKVISGVAVMPLTGVLRDEADWMVRFGYASSYQIIERDIKAAMSDAQVKGVLLYCDTPGGSAIGCKRVADTIFGLRGSKPIHAYVQGMCGSAGYYIASACDRIEATADSLVGSIGTIYPHLEYAKAIAEAGYSATVFTNSDSPNKGHGHPFQSLSDDARKTLQQFTNSYGDAFIEDVARYRGVDRREVVESYGQGDAFRADSAIRRGMVDAIVGGFSESMKAISGVESESAVEETDTDETPVVTGSFFTTEVEAMKFGKKIRAQLFAMDLIDNPDVSDEICAAAVGAWCSARGVSVPDDEAKAMAILQGKGADNSTPTQPEAVSQSQQADPPASNVQQAHDSEHGEAKLADLRASAKLVNTAAGRGVVTDAMVMDAFEAKQTPSQAMQAWNEKLAKDEPPVPSSRVNVTGEGADRFASDAIDAMVYRASDNPSMELSEGARNLANRPLWSIAGQCLELAGESVDMYGDRELIAEEAMQMGNATRRHVFHSGSEDRRYISAAGTPAARPGDFPNILSSLMNKFLDTIQLDDDYSYPEISAVLPGGLNDFKPAMMVNKGIVEELDELSDAEQFKELGLQEEVLSYIFLRRFGNKWGWTPVLIANDDMNAFAEGMLGLQEAWQVTQNRLVLDRYTSSETLLDGSALFANRADTGTGSNPATNHNIVTGGAAPSDAQWGLMETQYADIGGIGTGRRVRGTLNVCLCPTGSVYQEARRTFLTFPTIGESKEAATTANVGLYRGQIKVVPESELRPNSAIIYYGLRNPTRLNTATVVRGYFNGYGAAGRRERWYDPTNKTTWVSIEGRIAVAVKNWRYAVRNAGTGA